MKTTITASLSKESLEKAKKQLEEFNILYQKGVKNAVKAATEAMYNKVLEHCYDVGIYNDVDKIYWEFDEDKLVGRVWSNDLVIVFNEMGTGIVGSSSPHPKPSSDFQSWKYDVNEHGEKGWKYPKKDGTFGWTRGLPSRHMFYDAFNDIKDEIGDIVEVEIRRIVGD